MGCFDEFPLLRFQVAGKCDIEHAENAGHRGSQFVAHVGEELALGLSSRLGQLFRLLRIFLSPLSVINFDQQRFIDGSNLRGPFGDPLLQSIVQFLECICRPFALNSIVN